MKNSLLLIQVIALFFGILVPVHAQEKADYTALCVRSKAEAQVPLRPGICGKQPFWNEKSMMFKYAPVFNSSNTSWVIRNPAYYKYTVYALQAAKIYSFTSDSAFAPLTPVWADLPPGEYMLKVEAMDADSVSSVLAGKHSFVKSPAFCPPYSDAHISYRKALLKGLNFVINQPHIQYWIEHAMPNHSLHTLYCYPALEVGSVINAMLLYHKYFPKHKQALTIARKAADYLIETSEPDTSPLAYFPQIYEGNNLSAGKFGTEMIMTEAATVGTYMLDLFEITGDVKYKQTALNIARSYVKTQLPSGTWHIRLHKSTGKPVSPELCIPIRISNFLEILSVKYGYSEFDMAAEKAVEWIWQNPMKTYNWTGQFEDVEAVKPYQNLTKYEASWFAQRLFKQANGEKQIISSGIELTRFCEDQFVVWDKTGIYDNWGNSTENWHTPCVLEQYFCYVPIDASAVQMIETFLAAFQATGDVMYKEKAGFLANSLVNVQEESGRIPTFWAKGFTEFWHNCMINSLYLLDTFNTMN